MLPSAVGPVLGRLATWVVKLLAVLTSEGALRVCDLIAKARDTAVCISGGSGGGGPIVDAFLYRWFLDAGRGLGQPGDALLLRQHGCHGAGRARARAEIAHRVFWRAAVDIVRAAGRVNDRAA